ncbi:MULTISPECIES: alpha/beta fold hydrolase [Aerococcus]|uniref:Alpha/beta hydrolase n=1 Tax=Aerococcus sanguinicola TaxID=119206 RepID=A0A5N1GQ14_9LACT|nr:MULTISPECIES: alpha/beta hydrolase [Aerococcus]KAA9302141.1 alpha/beta hydrolase [Aerococcus sanguinicola]MDK6368428.1 alpha/beta hydrolase [Aerococcus sp. UMB9870]MDK6679511.1 alpha/beta hydrolase [Aerococcus sp. UMB8608]MDK6686355.1 alpha/beta hydrolase [Aerococcus sp. UMB8623]MDK6941023.1 alpha/beta hydrolase [Aerococcus sp. UMB8487]
MTIFLFVIALSLLALLLCRAIKARLYRYDLAEDLVLALGPRAYRQAVQVRGQDRSKPLLIWLHGGPGVPNPALSYSYQQRLAKDFIICYWTQAGSGRSYYFNPDRSQEGPSFQELEASLDDLVDQVCQRYGKKKVVLLGHSFGSMLGLRYAKSHPEKLWAYVGVSQITDMIAGDFLILDLVEGQMNRLADRRALAYLSQAKQATRHALQSRYIEAKNYLAVERLAQNYLRTISLRDQARLVWQVLTSPDLNWADLRWYGLIACQTQRFTQIQADLMEEAQKMDLSTIERLEVPLLLISGALDWQAPLGQVFDFFDQVRAPQQAFRMLPGAGHSPFLSHPKLFSQCVKDFLSYHLK